MRKAFIFPAVTAFFLLVAMATQAAPALPNKSTSRQVVGLLLSVALLAGALWIYIIRKRK